MSDHEVVHAPATERAQRSVLRYTLLVASAFLLAVPGAYLASPSMHSSHTAEGKLWFEGGTPGLWSIAMPGAPVDAPRSSAWVDLLRSYAVLGPVVQDGRLSVQAPEKGVTLSPRDAARELSLRLMVVTEGDGHVIRVTLEGTDARETARVLNAVMESVVDVAGKLKRARLEKQLSILEEQVEQTELELRQAEADLGEFRNRTTRVSSGRTTGLDEEQIVEARLRRRVQVAESLYTDLYKRMQSAELAAASSTPDLRILDRASVPDAR